MTREEALTRASDTLAGLKEASGTVISIDHAQLTVDYANALIAYAAELRAQPVHPLTRPLDAADARFLAGLDPREPSV